MKRLDGQQRQRTTPEQLAYVREHWATATCGEIEAAIGVRRATVKAIASRLGLEKDAEFLSLIRCRASARDPLAIPRRKTGRRATNPTPLGTHLDVLLGIRRVDIPASTGRVHRIFDDELEAA